MSRQDDTLFMGELKAAVVRRPVFAANLLLFSIAAFIVCFAVWAYHAPLEEVTRGVGQVIPSSQVQIIQNLEGGIVSEILVKEGQTVVKGQPLIIIDDTQFRSKFGEGVSQKNSLIASLSRLRAEIDGVEPQFSDELRTSNPEIVENEFKHYTARQEELNNGIAVFEQQLEQKKQELLELGSRITQLEKSYALGKQEIEIITPSVERGATSAVELIRLQREVNGIESSLLETQMTLPQVEAVMAEIRQRIDEKKSAFITRSLAELNETKAKLDTLGETLVASADRLLRTTVLSPVAGTVKQVMVNTIGGVISPGMNIVEIVADDDTLLVEAKVNPKDIAFLHPGQEASVKLTAYDYSIYGSLEAALEHISADAIIDQNGASFYKIKVRTKKSYLESTDGNLPIMPGMVAEVDILTGSKTVFEYLMKPILRAKSKALRER